MVAILRDVRARRPTGSRGGRPAGPDRDRRAQAKDRGHDSAFPSRATRRRPTAAYVVAESARSADGREVRGPRLLRWYRGDFGGRGGTLALLRRHGGIEPDESPRLCYADYDWTLHLEDAAPS